jgi:hypothetical protein
MGAAALAVRGAGQGVVARAERDRRLWIRGSQDPAVRCDPGIDRGHSAEPDPQSARRRFARDVLTDGRLSAGADRRFDLRGVAARRRRVRLPAERRSRFAGGAPECPGRARCLKHAELRYQACLPILRRMPRLERNAEPARQTVKFGLISRIVTTDTFETASV